MDINTKQRPVPNQLLLDIKRLAENETDEEALMRDVFDLFSQDPSSPLLGLMSPSEKQRGRISRVTFNAAMKTIWRALAPDATFVYETLSAYLRAWMSELRARDSASQITNARLFRAILLLFPAVAERVSLRYGNTFTDENFKEMLQPVFSRMKTGDVKAPGLSPAALFDSFEKSLRGGFSIGQSRS
jgi:hypothetical protein